VVQLIPGIGPATAARLLDAMSEAAEPQDVVENFEPPTAAAAEWRAFAVLYRALRSSSTAAWPADIALAKRWYAAFLADVTDPRHRANRELDVARLESVEGLLDIRLSGRRVEVLQQHEAPRDK
jgi:DNA helicase-2/ATP-dependent DNA helicase PcrA